MNPYVIYLALAVFGTVCAVDSAHEKRYWFAASYGISAAIVTTILIIHLIKGN